MSAVEVACPELWATLGEVGGRQVAGLRDVMCMGGKMPEVCARVVHAFCVIFSVAPERHTETFPPGSGKKPVVHLLWGACAPKVLADFSRLRSFSPELLTEAQRVELAKVVAHADFTAERLGKASSAYAALVPWVKKALELSASVSPQQRAQAALAGATARLEAKQALLAKAREAVETLEGEVRALVAEQEAAGSAASGPAAAGGGGGHA